MLLLAEWTPELGRGGLSRNRLSRYAGRVPHVDGRGSAIVIAAIVREEMDNMQSTKCV